MLAVAIFNFPYAPVRNLALALALTAVIAGAMALTVAVTPFVMGCCVTAAPVVGQALLAGGLLYTYAVLTQPRYPQSR